MTKHGISLLTTEYRVALLQSRLSGKWKTRRRALAPQIRRSVTIYNAQTTSQRSLPMLLMTTQRKPHQTARSEPRQNGSPLLPNRIPSQLLARGAAEAPTAHSRCAEAAAKTKGARWLPRR